MRLTRHLLGVALAVVAAAALAPSLEAATECSADVRARLARDESRDQVVEKVFAVEVDTREACAKVYVDFTSTERLANGEEITTTRRGWRKVSASDTTYKVNYRVERDTELIAWSFKVARCVVCGTE